MEYKDYLTKAHRVPLITNDPNREDDELRGVVPRGIMSYHVDMLDFKEFEESFDNILDYDIEPTPNTAIHRVQGKKGVFDGIKFDSVWEYAYYRYTKDIKGEYIERNTTENFPYYINGQKHKFYPDFKISIGFVEVKGIWREKDLQKQAQHPTIIFLDAAAIKPIMKELDEFLPNWRNDYVTL